ncbi:gag-pol [Trichonephila clavipes]|nr:gag-pol [Trichonephila clavipes]
MADVQDLKSALKFEAAIPASRRDHYSIRGARVMADAPCESPSEGNGGVSSRRHCPGKNKYSLRVEKKFGMIDPVVRQVTTPSTSELDPWSDDSVRKDQLADPEIKPIIEYKECYIRIKIWVSKRLDLNLE